jgi:hypothetical protein
MCAAQHVVTDQTVLRNPLFRAPAHNCPKLGGVQVPYVEVGGQRSRLVLVERDDYEGAELGLVHTDDGRSITSVRTERYDGSNDTVVFAPTAHADLREIL